METYRAKDLFRDAADMVSAGFLFLAATALSGGLLFGAALKALLAVAFRIVDGKKAVRVLADGWTAFKADFLFSEAVWAVAAGMGALLYLAATTALDAGQPWVAGAAVASAVLLAAYLMTFYPLLAVFRTERPGAMLKNAFLLAAGKPATTVLLLGTLAVPILLFFLWYGTILVSPALFAAFVALRLNRVYAPYRERLAPEPPAEGKE